MPQNDHLGILACPDCNSGFSVNSLGAYVCSRMGEEYFPIGDAPNFLPFKLREENSFRFNGIPKKTVEVKSGGLRKRISTGELTSFLLNAGLGNSRGILSYIREVIDDLPNECYDGEKLTIQGVKLVSGLFNQILVKYEDHGDDYMKRQLVGASHQARYEAELESLRDYPGNFKLPLALRGMLPRKGNVLEVAMGNGTNLQELVEEGEFENSIGLDYSYGMVRAARERDESSSIFYAIADAHHLPIADKSMDLVLMFNALDRVSSPPEVLAEIERVSRPGSTIVLGQCMPFQYDVQFGKTRIGSISKDQRLKDLEDAVNRVNGAQIVSHSTGNVWHPETVTQGVETLYVDIVVAKVA